jgi:DinB superfamily
MPSTYAPPTDPTTLAPQTLANQLRTAVTRAEHQLTPLTPEQADQPLAPGKWSTKQTIGHLIDSCANNHQRLIRLQLAPTLTFPGYQQNEWVALQRYDLLPWPEVFALFLTLNRHFAHTIEHADAATLTHTWLFEGEHLTLGFILADYLGHLDHHLRQLPNYTSPA